MDSFKLASGDNNKSPTFVEGEMGSPETNMNNIQSVNEKQVRDEKQEENLDNQAVTPQAIEENEIKVKERIAQCRGIIESLKLELYKEKSKLEKENKTIQEPSVSDMNITFHQETVKADFLAGDFYSSSVYSACVDRRLNCDENIIEYEKQLQRYQNTLNMAQVEKKNAIRKQMLAKAFRLKLLEVENQCNIELLRVKQSLQCLEPLQIIANKWKTTSDDSTYDLNNFELIPRFPELNANSGSDINSYRDDCEVKPSPENLGVCGKEDSSSSDC